MIDELNALYNAGGRGSVFIVDDNFIGNKAKVKERLPEVIKWQKKRKYPFVFGTEASINLADDEELMYLMSAANFDTVFIGIESTNMESLKECSKMQNTSVNLAKSVRKIQKNGMAVQGGFILGFDSDTENIFEAQMKFIQEVGIVTAMVGLLNAVPGTRLWKRLNSEGRLLKSTTGENTDGTINFIPKMNVEKLVKGYKKIIKSIYSPKNYYKRIHTLIKHYKPKVRSRMSWSDIRAFFLSTWRIGIISKSRKHYWKLIVKTLITKKKAFPLAITLAIQGHHLEIVSKKVADA